MQEDNIAAYKSERFAVRIIKLYKILCSRDKCHDLFRQLLRAGTSITANMSEAECAISPNEFTSKVYISYKECNETATWLRLLKASDYLSDKEFKSIYSDCQELKRILSSITKTMKDKTLNKSS